MKLCTNCKIEKLFDYFYKSTRSKDGLCNICIDCQKEKNKLYHYKNRNKRLEYFKNRRKLSPEKYKELDKKYYRNNKESRDISHKKWRDKNPDYIKQYKEKNKERSRLQQVERRKTNPEYDKMWRSNNRDKRRSSVRKWEKNNPLYCRERARRRRARKMNQLGDPVPENYEYHLMCQQGGTCYYCGIILDNWHQDHMVSLAKGGLHDPENLCLACPPCNFSKNSKNADEFIQEQYYACNNR